MSASLAASVERLTAAGADAPMEEMRALVAELFAALESGEVRAAQPFEGGWRVNTWVKQGILLAFRCGSVEPTEPVDQLPLPYRQGRDSILDAGLERAATLAAIAKGDAVPVPY